MEHDEATLPRWARQRLEALRQQRDQLLMELVNTRMAAAITRERDHWFTVAGPQDGESQRLYWLSRDGARPACALGPGDVLLVGRAPCRAAG